jgi:hypothetical protein
VLNYFADALIDWGCRSGFLDGRGVSASTGDRKPVMNDLTAQERQLILTFGS